MRSNLQYTFLTSDSRWVTREIVEIDVPDGTEPSLWFSGVETIMAEFVSRGGIAEKMLLDFETDGYEEDIRINASLSGERPALTAEIVSAKTLLDEQEANREIARLA